VDWTTRYQLEGARDQTWRECRVVDVSRAGLGVVLPDITPDRLRGQRIRVEVAVETPPVILRPCGQVRHLHPLDDGAVHIGLEFASLSALERHLLDTLINA
jgi:c-di-GMP-binding flagellar brake protein YcgR